MKSSKKINGDIAKKKLIIQKYKKVFDIVKRHIDNLDLMGLLEMCCPQDEYDFEIADIVKNVIKIKDANMLADIIEKVFSEAFEENFSEHRERIFAASKEILNELKILNRIEKETYFIPKELLPGSCYFEFQQGKYKIGRFGKTGEQRLDSSLYLYGDDDGHFNYSAIAPFTCLMSGSHPDPKAAKFFDYCGITYIDENDGKIMISNLRYFAKLIEEGKTIINALEQIGVFSCSEEEKWIEEAMRVNKIPRERIETFDYNQRVSSLDPIILKNTAEELADWSERTLAEYKMISVLGI